MTRISFTRGLKDEAEAGPADPAGAQVSLGFVVACAALATLALALALTVFFTLRGLGKDHAPPPVPPLAVTVPIPAAAQAPTPATPAPAAVDHSQAMIAALSRAKGVLTLEVENDPSAEASARDISQLFKLAGWTVTWNSTFGTAAPRVGLAAALGFTPQDDAIREAFGKAGIQMGPPPRSTGVVQTPEIFVGADRPAR